MRFVVIQNNYHIGDFDGNVAKINQAIQTHGGKVDFIVFTELCLSGYYPYDLIDRHSFIEAQSHALEAICKISEQYDCFIVLGLITPNPGKGKPFHNSMVVLHQGQNVYEYHKQLLPVYNIFDEARHFEPGGHQALFEYKDQRIGFLLCEDAWGTFREFYEEDPVEALLKQNPTLTIVLNASPSNLGKVEARLAHMKKVTDLLKTPLIYANQVGGSDDMVYDGQSFVLDKDSKVLGILSAFEESSGHLEVNQEKLTLQEGWKSLMVMNDIELLYHQIILGLKDYIRKANFKGVLVGVSGGIDSAMTLALAVKALGPQACQAIFMPTRFTSKESVEDATSLCDNLGVKLYHYPIDKAYEDALADFKTAFGEQANGLTAQNIQARLRGRILMEYSNHTGYMVLATGNKSEISVGYTTIYGDMTGGFNIIGDVYKTQVYALAKLFNEYNPQTQIPEHIITRAPTAELKENQKDTDTLPPYEQLDALLKIYIEGDLLPLSELKACKIIAEDIPIQVRDKVHRMVDMAEFKRRQSPPIVRCQRRSFGWGRKMPISARYFKT